MDDPIVVSTFSTTVYGVKVEIDPQVIYEIFGIPRVQNYFIYPISELDNKENIAQKLCEQSEHQVFCGNKIQTSLCHLTARVLNKIFSQNLLPTYHQSNMYMDMINLVYCYLQGQKIDAPELIYEKIIIDAKKVVTLPFGILITKILKHFRVPLPIRNTIKILKWTSNFSMATLRRMKIPGS